MLVKKECFKKVGLFDENLESCEDWDMWIRIAKYYKFIFLETTLVKYVIHSDQLSENLLAKINARKRILFKYQDELKNRKFVHSHHYYKIGNLCCLSGINSNSFVFNPDEYNLLFIKNLLVFLTNNII